MKVIACVTFAPSTVTCPTAGFAVYPAALTENEELPFRIPVKAIVLPVPLSVTALNVTDHVAPGESPLSMNVTVYVVGTTAVNVIVSATAAPFTVTDPEDGLAVYPDTGPTVNEYVPFALVNVIVGVAEVAVAPFSVTDQVAPESRPLSVNVTAYVPGVRAVKAIT